MIIKILQPEKLLKWSQFHHCSLNPFYQLFMIQKRSPFSMIGAVFLKGLAPNTAYCPASLFMLRCGVGKALKCIICFWIGYSMSSWVSLAGVLLRWRPRKLQKQEEAVRAMRLRPMLRQCTSDVTGTSANRARSRGSCERLSLFSMSFTMFRISCLSICRVIPRIFRMADTCFFL